MPGQNPLISLCYCAHTLSAVFPLHPFSVNEKNLEHLYKNGESSEKRGANLHNRHTPKNIQLYIYLYYYFFLFTKETYSKIYIKTVQSCRVGKRAHISLIFNKLRLHDFCTILHDSYKSAFKVEKYAVFQFSTVLCAISTELHCTVSGRCMFQVFFRTIVLKNSDDIDRGVVTTCVCPSHMY